MQLVQCVVLTRHSEQGEVQLVHTELIDVVWSGHAE